MSIRQRISNEAELQQKVQAAVTPLLTTITKEHQAEITGYQVAKRQKRRVTVFLLTFLGLFILASIWQHVLIVILVFVFLFLTIRAWWRYGTQLHKITAYHQAVTGSTLVSLAGIFGLEQSLVQHADTNDQNLSWWQQLAAKITGEDKEYYSAVKARLATSELITEPYNRLSIDDSWELTYHDSRLQLSELSVKQVTQRGKHKHVKEIFHGYFASYTLPKSLQGKTFISTDGDRNGFGHQSFWTRYQADAVAPTELEWNEFENLLHVATNNPTEARYILTPDVMQDIYDWWVEKPGNIRICFVGDELHLLFPDSDMRLARSVSELNEKELEEYVLLLSRPLFHILQLIDDIRARFR